MLLETIPEAVFHESASIETRICTKVYMCKHRKSELVRASMGESSLAGGLFH